MSMTIIVIDYVIFTSESCFQIYFFLRTKCLYLLYILRERERCNAYILWIMYLSQLISVKFIQHFHFAALQDFQCTFFIYISEEKRKRENV